jgi:hypothetical protein
MTEDAGYLGEHPSESTRKGSNRDMGIKRLEVEIKDLSQRVSKLEARTEGAAGRSPKSRAADSHPHPQIPEGPAIQEPLSEWPAIETIEFRSVAPFERDLAGLDVLERQRVIDSINAKSSLWLKDRAKAEKEFLRPYRFLLCGGLESSLYEICIGMERRVILAVDDDPIFGRVIVTLMRILPKGERKAAYDELAKLLYPGQILEVQTLKDR